MVVSLYSTTITGNPMSDFNPIPPRPSPDPDPSPPPSPDHDAAPDWSAADLPEGPDPAEAFERELGPKLEDPAAPPAPAVLDKVQFFAAFRFLIGAPNIAVRPPLESLKVAENDQAARQASDALYDTAAEVPWLHWLIEPQNRWVQRALVVSVFGYQLGGAVRAEIAARRVTGTGGEAPAADAPTPPPAPPTVEPAPGTTFRQDGKTYHELREAP